MKLSTVFASALLALAATVTANPIPDTADPIADRHALLAEADAISKREAEGEEVGLVKRKELNCKIVNVKTTVDCHYWPTHAKTWKGMKNHVVTSFKGNTKHDYNCYLSGETVGGISTWDYANNWDCFVPGYYTDSHCLSKTLGKCAF